MNALRSKHQALIDGLGRFYNCLVAMHFINASDILHPPHINPPIDVAKFQRMGLEREVVDVIQELPVLRDEVVWPNNSRSIMIAPLTKALNYFKDDFRLVEEFNHLRRGGFSIGANERDLDPWMLRLTDGEDDGAHLIYNVRDCKLPESLKSLAFLIPFYYYAIVILHDADLQLEGTLVEWRYHWISGSRIYWYDLAWRPASTVLSEWLNKLKTLEWIPWRRGSEMPDPEILWPPTSYYDTHQKIGFIGGMHDNGWVTAGVRANLYLALKRIYKRCGWPDEFRSNDFAQDIADFTRQFTEKDDAINFNWRIPSDLSKQEVEMMFQQAEARMNTFLMEYAKENER